MCVLLILVGGLIGIISCGYYSGDVLLYYMVLKVRGISLCASLGLALS